LAASLFFNPCTHLAAKIRTGEFDIALAKPLSPFGHEFCMGFNLGYVSHVTLSIAVMIFATIRAGVNVTILWILLCVGMLLGAILVQGAFLIFTSAFSFFLINENPFFDILWTLKNFTNYPPAHLSRPPADNPDLCCAGGLYELLSGRRFAWQRAGHRLSH
jgi:ABC-2 type transport system permease protein